MGPACVNFARISGGGMVGDAAAGDVGAADLMRYITKSICMLLCTRYASLSLHARARPIFCFGVSAGVGLFRA